MRDLLVFTIDNCSNFEDYLKIHNKEDQRANNFYLFGSKYDYSELPGEFIAIKIFLFVFGIVMQSFAIAYERFHMDPMKRGLVNQLSTTYMAFTMCFSMTRIIRYFIEWLAPHLLHPSIFNGFRLVGWFAWFACSFGCLITVNEVIFFTYWSKLWLKRVPNYNHDFLAVWLNAANVFMAFYFGGLQVYNSMERAKDEENVPRLRIFLCLGIITVLQVIVYIVHYMIDWFKTRNRTSIVPMVHEQVFSIPIQEQPVVPLPQLLNTMKFNPDLLNWKVALGVIAITPPLFYYSFKFRYCELKYPPIPLNLGIIQCFYVPLIFCALNPKLRSFIQSHFTFR